MEAKIIKTTAAAIKAVAAAAPVKKPVKQKKVKMFTLNDYQKIDKWERALPPQAKDIATKLHHYGIEWGKPFTREKISDAMEKMANSISESTGKQWTRQEPYRIFAYYVKPLRENGLLTIS